VMQLSCGLAQCSEPSMILRLAKLAESHLPEVKLPSPESTGLCLRRARRLRQEASRETLEPSRPCAFNLRHSWVPGQCSAIRLRAPMSPPPRMPA